MVTTKTKVCNVLLTLIQGLITVYSASHPEKCPVLLAVIFGAVFVLQVAKTIVDFRS